MATCGNYTPLPGDWIVKGERVVVVEKVFPGRVWYARCFNFGGTGILTLYDKRSAPLDWFIGAVEESRPVVLTRSPALSKR